MNDADFLAGAMHERRRIGQDLHNTVLQDLAYVRLQLEHQGAAADVPAGVRQALFDLRDTVGEAAVDLRAIVAELVFSDLSIPLADALSESIDRFRHKFEGTVELGTSGDLDVIDSKTKVHILRTVSEALNNVWKHAQARAVRVDVRVDGAGVRLRVQDDGIGFQGNSHDGLGLFGLRQSGKELGGTVLIDSQPDHGTTITVQLPLPRGRRSHLA